VTPDGSKRTIQSNDPLFPAVFGSEGQLGVITGVTLTVREIPRRPKPHMIFFDEPKSALSFAYALASGPVHPAHIVYESAAKFSLINRALGQNRFPASDAIIVSVENEESEHLFQAHLKSTGVKEEKEYLARYLWNERYFPMKVRKFGPGMLGSEVTVPLNLLSDVLAKAVDLCRDLGLEPLGLEDGEVRSGAQDHGGGRLYGVGEVVAVVDRALAEVLEPAPRNAGGGVVVVGHLVLRARNRLRFAVSSRRSSARSVSVRGGRVMACLRVPRASGRQRRSHRRGGG